MISHELCPTIHYQVVNTHVQGRKFPDIVHFEYNNHLKTITIRKQKYH